MKKKVCASQCRVSIHEHRASASNSILDWKGTSASVKQCTQYWQRQNCTFVWKKWTCCVFTMLYGESIIFSWCSIEIYLKLCFSFMYKENYISICITFDMLLNFGRKVPAKVHWKTRREICFIPVFNHSSRMETLWSYKNGLQCVCIKLLDVWATVHMGFWSSFTACLKSLSLYIYHVVGISGCEAHLSLFLFSCMSSVFLVVIFVCTMAELQRCS